MSIKLKLPDLTEMRPRIVVIGVGGAGGNAVNNMIQSGIEGVEFVAANTDAQALAMSGAGNRIQMGAGITEGLGAGSKPEIGAAAAEEALDEIRAAVEGAHMLFITAGMGGGTGTGAAPVISRAAKELGVLTVAVVSKPFEFEGQRRMRIADQGVAELSKFVDTMIVIPNQNLFRIANEKTTFVDAFHRADEVLKSGVSCITDLMVKEGLINLDFADVRVVMQNMGTALMGTGEAEGEKRSLKAAEGAISNPLLGEVSMRGAKGLLVSITGSGDMTLYEVEEAASRIRREVDPDSNPDINIIVGATFDKELKGRIRVSVVATGIQSGIGFDAVRLVDAGRKDGLSDRLNASGARASVADAEKSPVQTGVRGAPRNPDRSSQNDQRPQTRSESSDLRQRVPASPHFDASPQKAPMKPPRRPLTSDDFPELGGSSAPGAKDSPRRGLFDWMAGRSRSRDSSRLENSVTSAQRDRKTLGTPDTQSVIIERHGERKPNSGASDDASPARRPEPSLSDRKATPQADDTFEIPQFFKR
ncbi:MAG: cell division protein FtsZ [Chitinophagales bacterium]|nr:cell division protein FtsZ [Hyphomicrobiales bacterium]